MTSCLLCFPTHPEGYLPRDVTVISLPPPIPSASVYLHLHRPATSHTLARPWPPLGRRPPGPDLGRTSPVHSWETPSSIPVDRWLRVQSQFSGISVQQLPYISNMYRSTLQYIRTGYLMNLYLGYIESPVDSGIMISIFYK